MNRSFKIITVAIFVFFSSFCYAETLQEQKIDHDLVAAYKKVKPNVCSELSDQAVSVLARLANTGGDQDKLAKVVKEIGTAYDIENPGFGILGDDDAIDLGNDNLHVFFYKLFYPETTLSNEKIFAMASEELKKEQDGVETADWYKDYDKKSSLFLEAAMEAFSGGMTSEEIGKSAAESIGEAFSYVLEKILEKIWA